MWSVVENALAIHIEEYRHLALEHHRLHDLYTQLQAQVHAPGYRNDVQAYKQHVLRTISVSPTFNSFADSPRLRDAKITISL
jgi:hypothetical protein